MILKFTDIRTARERWLAAVEHHYPEARVFDCYHGMFAITDTHPTEENGFVSSVRVGHYDRMIGGFIY